MPEAAVDRFALITLLTLPIAVTLWNRRLALRRQAVDRAAAWYRYWRVERRVLLGMVIAWGFLVLGTPLGPLLSAQIHLLLRLDPEPASRLFGAEVLSVAVYLVPPFGVITLCMYLSHAVYTRVRGLDWTRGDMLRMAFSGSFRNILGIAFLFAGFGAMAGRERGDFARQLKKPLGKALGYLPFFYELGLQLVLVGRDFLHRASDIERFVDTINTQTVILQSIHLVETAFSRDMAQASDLAIAETPDLPSWTSRLEAAIRIKNPSFRFEPGKIHAHYCATSGYASLSASTWGLNQTRLITDAIENAISRFLEKH
jgi:hypothetical protein